MSSAAFEPVRVSSPLSPVSLPAIAIGIVLRSSSAESLARPTSTSIVLMPVPGQLTVWLSTAMQRPLEVMFAAESVIV